MTNTGIAVEGLRHSYGGRPAVDGLSFTVQKGEIVGFLGANGAGKTTTLRAIAGTLEPDAGRIQVAGVDTRRDPLAARTKTGYLAEHDGLWDGMSAHAVLCFHGAVRGLEGAALEQRLAWLTQRLELEPVLGKRVRECSLGFRRRIALAAALVHDPEVVLLDEPTHGLDPLQTRAFRRLLLEIAPDKAVLFSTHVLQEVEAVCTRVLVLQAGHLVLDAHLADLRLQAHAQRCTLEDLVVTAAARQPAQVVAP
jgi:ABC-2 type transport system ATP-binding protein